MRYPNSFIHKTKRCKIENSIEIVYSFFKDIERVIFIRIIKKILEKINVNTII